MILFFIVPEHTILGMIMYAGNFTYMVSIYKRQGDRVVTCGYFTTCMNVVKSIQVEKI